MGIDVPGYLSEQQRKSSSELAPEWAALEELYNKKLWHQLTLRLGEFIKNPALLQGDALVKLYQNFIVDFENRINPLALAEIIVVVSRQIKDVTESLQFLEKAREKVKQNDEAMVLLSTAIGSLYLSQRNLDATKNLIRDTQAILDTLDNVTSVHGRFYELSSEYHKLMGNHADYYRDALRFLGCVDISEIPASDQADRAFSIGLAAILGKEIYNFGELLAHPVLEVLKATQDRKWLVDLLIAFNSGDMPAFESLKLHWQTQADLAAHELPMRRKMALLCLMEMTFRRPATDRRLSFDDIAEATRLAVCDVENLVMHALAVGLIRGSIDEVDRRVHVTWVQPRVLSREQIAVMWNKMETWAVDIAHVEKLVETKGADILS